MRRTHKVSKYKSPFCLFKARIPQRLKNDKQKLIWLKRWLIQKIRKDIAKQISFMLRPKEIKLEFDMFPFIGGDKIYGSGL